MTKNPHIVRMCGHKQRISAHIVPSAEYGPAGLD